MIELTLFLWSEVKFEREQEEIALLIYGLFCPGVDFIFPADLNEIFFSPLLSMEYKSSSSISKSVLYSNVLGLSMYTYDGYIFAGMNGFKTLPELFPLKSFLPFFIFLFFSYC